MSLDFPLLRSLILGASRMVRTDLAIWLGSVWLGLALFESAAIAQPVRSDSEILQSSDSPLRLRFRFRGATWREVLSWLSREGDLAISAPTVPESLVDFQDPTRTYTLDEALDSLGRLLLHEQFAYVRSGRFVTIVDLKVEAISDPLHGMSSSVEVEQLNSLPQAQIVRCRFDLSRLLVNGNVDQKRIVNSLQGLVHPAGKFFLLPSTNEAVIIDSVQQLRIIAELLSSQKEAVELTAKTIHLEHQPSDRMLASLLPTIRSMDGVEREGQLQSVKVTEGFDSKSLILLADPRSGKLIEAIIQQLDRRTAKAEIESISLHGLSVDTIRERLSVLLNVPTVNSPSYDGDGRPVLQNPNDLRLDFDSENGSLWVRGDKPQRDGRRRRAGDIESRFASQGNLENQRTRDTHHLADRRSFDCWR
jgi:hypothetical protein